MKPNRILQSLFIAGPVAEAVAEPVAGPVAGPVAEQLVGLLEALGIA